MNRLPLKLVWITLACDAAGFLFFFILSANQFSSQLYEIYFRPSWIINNTLILFLENLTAFHCSGVVITYSFLYRKNFRSADAQDPSGPFYKLVLASLVFILISALAAALLNELVVPQAAAAHFRQRQLTGISRDIYRRAGEEENQENYAEAYRLYKEYINIFPNLRDDLSEVNARLERRMAEENQEDSPASSDSPGPSRSGPAGLTSRELLNRAQESERQEDYFSAYYYSDLAFKQDSNFIDARDFASQMQAAIEHSAPPLEERVQARIFSDKKQGADFLTNGKPVDAYYTFLRLKIYLDTNNLPPDPDVELYITLAEEAAKEVSFYPEDVQFLESSPGYDGIFFLNRSSQEDPSLGESERELIFFEKAVPHYPAGESWMIRNGAVIRFDSQGIIYSLRADYGKILFKSPEESYLILRGIDGETRETFSDVRFLEGRNRPEIPYLIPLRISHNQLNLAAEETQDYRLTSLGWLLGARKLITDLGIFSWSLSRRIIEKLIFPFSFLVLSLFSLALGWRLRWRSGALAPAYWLIFPVLPFFFVRLMEFYRSAFLLITQFVLSWLGYLPALLLLLISQGALLVLAFIILAGQSGE